MLHHMVHVWRLETDTSVGKNFGIRFETPDMNHWNVTFYQGGKPHTIMLEKDKEVVDLNVFGVPVKVSHSCLEESPMPHHIFVLSSNQIRLPRMRHSWEEELSHCRTIQSYQDVIPIQNKII
ncbi:unnamed protein product [Orchesella dallaii]|uniref:Uncharacterized protein n=1 Tax=Orchesella dallaii TaxID=48710 RepID=A0ABP1QWD8_9HEXA